MLLQTQDHLQEEYLKLQHQLIIKIDAAYGIKSKFKFAKSKKRFPTGVYWKRDASNAKPAYCGDDDANVVKSNLLLRLLATTRAIDFALQNRAERYPDHATNYEIERHALKVLYDVYQTDVQAQSINLKVLEKAYNFELVKILHAHCLDFGLKTTKEYQKLLLHYRCLASTLDPAPSVQTILKDQTNNLKHIETAHPITQKTTAQLAALQEMERVALRPLPEQKNYHTVQKCAFQEANLTFAALIQMPNRRLPAQSRKMCAPTVKNGYLTNYRIKSKEALLGEMWALRSGTAVYVGKGESEESLVQRAEENFQQMMLLANQVAGATNLHITLLNTLSPFSRQHIMVRVTDQARKAFGYNISYVPLNFDGTFRMTEISSVVRQNNAQVMSQMHPGNKSGRLTVGVGISSIIRKDSLRKLDNKLTINLITCASGQDRTGTLCEAAALQFACDIYQEKLPAVAFGKQAMERLRAPGMHNAFLATIAAPGSLGLKNDSQPGDYFSYATNRQFYLEVARTNSKCPLSDAEVKQLSEVERHAWALHDLPRISALWHDWQQDSVIGYLDTPRMSDTQRLDSLIEQYKISYEAKPSVPVMQALKDSTEEDIGNITDAQAAESLNAEKLIKQLDEIEKTTDKWLASKWNQAISERVPAVQNLKRNIAIEKYLLTERANLDAVLQDNLNNWLQTICVAATNKTNSSGVQKMFKLVQHFNNVDDLILEQKIYLLKSLQGIAEDRLKNNWFKQCYCKASFWFKQGRQQNVQSLYEAIQTSEFLTSTLPSPPIK